jgi:hypothetical protein
MKVITITVKDEAQAQKVLDVLTTAEEEGDLDFYFNVATEDLVTGGKQA